MYASLEKRLQEHQQASLYRHTQVMARAQGAEIQYQGKTYLSFASNDYLGLAHHPQLIRALQKSAERYGVGSGSSALISGYSPAHQALEQAFARFLQRDRALYFPNGYMANLGVITALMRSRQDVVYQDKLNHASLIDAAQLSSAKLLRYPHLDYGALEKLLNVPTQGQRLIVSESIFSMEGAQASVKSLISLAQAHHSLLMIDDAHAVGVTGLKGAGSAAQFSQEALPIVVCPLGKAFGCYGAIVAGPELMVESLIQFSRSYKYTTASPPALADAAHCALELVQSEDWRRIKLKALVEYFRQQARALELRIGHSAHAIQTLIVGSSAKALQLSQALLKEGIYIPAIRPPTVPEGSARLRISLSALHSEADVDRLFKVLVRAHETV